MRRLLAVAVALPLGIALTGPPAAAAVKPRVQHDIEVGSLAIDHVACGQVVQVSADLPDRRHVLRFKVAQPWLGQPVYDSDRIEQVATVTAVQQTPRGLTATVTATDAACDPYGYPVATSTLAYEFDYAYELARSRLTTCGNLWWYYARATLRRNGNVACKKARRLTAEWRRADRRIRARCPEGTPCPFYLPRQLLGFRCAQHYAWRIGILRVNCRRRAQFVQWSWSDGAG